MTEPVGSAEVYAPTGHAMRDGAIAAAAAVLCSLGAIAATGTALDALAGLCMLLALFALLWLAALLTRGAFRALRGMPSRLRR